MIKYIFVFDICGPFHIFTIPKDVFPLKSHTKITKHPGYDLTMSTKHMNNETTVFSHEYQLFTNFEYMTFFSCLNWSILCQNISIQKVKWNLANAQNNVLFHFCYDKIQAPFNVLFFFPNPFLLFYLSICTYIFVMTTFVNDWKQKYVLYKIGVRVT